MFQTNIQISRFNRYDMELGGETEELDNETVCLAQIERDRVLKEYTETCQISLKNITKVICSRGSYKHIDGETILTEDV